jgi:signal transduction histidine kinase
MADEARFARIVSIGTHDLSTPLATIYGFARTLGRADLDEPAARYVGMIEAASVQLRELLDELSLLARIQTGRYDPALEDANTLVLAHEVATALPDRVAVSGEGATVRVDPATTQRSLGRLAKAATRHGGIDSVSILVRGKDLEISPLVGNAPAVVTGDDLKELGAAAAVEHLRALGVSVAAENERLLIRFPA